jgi:hypothetical protein
MSVTIEGGEYKPQIKLDGKKVIVENIGCYHYDKNSDTSFSYVREVVYHFGTEDGAMEYYYKMR